MYSFLLCIVLMVIVNLMSMFTDVIDSVKKWLLKKRVTKALWAIHESKINLERQRRIKEVQEMNKSSSSEEEESESEEVAEVDIQTA